MLRMGAEIERLRVELESRTRTMHGEMEKWRGQAEAAATSIREAKNEVLDRKRELDMTKEKMDALVRPAGDRTPRTPAPPEHAVEPGVHFPSLNWSGWSDTVA